MEPTMNFTSQGGVSQFPGGIMTFPGPQVQGWVGAQVQPVDGNTFAQFNPLIMENFNGGGIFPLVSSQMLNANFSVFPGMKHHLGSEFSVLRDAEIRSPAFWTHGEDFENIQNFFELWIDYHLDQLLAFRKF